jgi:hypothetical protein
LRLLGDRLAVLTPVADGLGRKQLPEAEVTRYGSIPEMNRRSNPVACPINARPTMLADTSMRKVVIRLRTSRVRPTGLPLEAQLRLEDRV